MSGAVKQVLASSSASVASKFVCFNPMAEAELQDAAAWYDERSPGSGLGRQSLDRRIPDKTTLVAEVANWERRRNDEKVRINWMFTIDRARVKLRRAYPMPADQLAEAAA